MADSRERQPVGANNNDGPKAHESGSAAEAGSAKQTIGKRLTEMQADLQRMVSYLNDREEVHVALECQLTVARIEDLIDSAETFGVAEFDDWRD